MDARTKVCGICMGMVLAFGLGTAGAQSQNGAPKAASAVADSGAKGGSGKPAAGKKRELTAEQKAFEQSLKSMRAQSGKLNEKFIKAARKGEKVRLEEEKAERTPESMPSGSVSGGTSQADPGGKGK